MIKERDLIVFQKEFLTEALMIRIWMKGMLK
jgi:hypothetical protein